MRTVTYTKTSFRYPDKISEQEYNNILSKLRQNSNYNILEQAETFSTHFKIELRTMGISVGVMILLIPFMEKQGITVLIFAVCFLSLFGMGISLLTEGPSFATYVKQRDEYFDKMKYAILNSSSYTHFVNTFYYN